MSSYAFSYLDVFISWNYNINLRNDINLVASEFESICGSLWIVYFCLLKLVVHGRSLTVKHDDFFFDKQTRYHWKMQKA